MKFWSAMLDLLYPPKCVFCHRLLENPDARICSQCRGRLPYTLEHGAQKGEFFSVCVAPLYYEGLAKESLHRFKFNNRREYAKTYGPMMADCIQETRLSWDVLTWVPVSKKRLRQRGYDQCQLLAQSVGSQMGCTPVSLLKKIRHTPAQSQTGTVEKRRANISGAYCVTSPELAAGQTVLLLDDIVTTGATLSECARILRFAGATDVCCAVIARRRD